MAETSYLDLLKKRLLNLPVVAWIVVAFAVVTAVVGLTSDVLPLIDRWKGSQKTGVHIALSSMDPRFAISGEVKNWGGGSQAVFFTLAEGRTGVTPGAVEPTEVPSGYDENDVRAVYEAPVLGEAVILANASYDAAEGSKCSILRWGIRAVPAEVPTGIVLAGYMVGGASGAYSGASTPVIEKGGTYPLVAWFEQDQEVARPRKYEFLSPGETTALEIRVVTPVDGVAERRALDLVVFADVLLDGERKTIESSERVQMILPSVEDVEDQRTRMAATAEERSRWDFVENIRHKAYVPR